MEFLDPLRAPAKFDFTVRPFQFYLDKKNGKICIEFTSMYELNKLVYFSRDEPAEYYHCPYYLCLVLCLYVKVQVFMERC